jgi:hypothetical protein
MKHGSRTTSSVYSHMSPRRERGVGLITPVRVGMRREKVLPGFRPREKHTSIHSGLTRSPFTYCTTHRQQCIRVVSICETHHLNTLEICPRLSPTARPSSMDAPPSHSRECQFCSAWFSRVDAARRHAKRCQKRDGRILLDRKRGRPARSCDQCSRVKVHCKADEEGSCRRCIPRGLRCTLDQQRPDPFIHGPSPVTSREELGRRDGRMELSSLLNLTDDHQDYLTEQTIGMEPDGVPIGPTCLPLTGTNALSDEVMDCLDPSILMLFDYEQYDTTVLLDGPHLAGGDKFSDSSFTMSWESAMSARLCLLEIELGKHAASSYDRTLSFDLHSHRSFFNVGEVHRFIMAFCRKRHYQYPIIHWPTFEAENASLPLLLVVALTGAAYSFGKDNGAACAIQAREYYRLADAYVFQSLERHLSELQTRRFELTESIELCQAALLMYALDTLPTGDMPLQHTAVATRLPMLVTALRRLNFLHVRHGQLEDWQTFVEHEKMIRIVAWTFCADCLATLTCNKPPSFSIPEMIGDLPCDPKVWEADEDSFSELSKGSKQIVSHNLRDLVSSWLNNDWGIFIDSLGLPVFSLHIMLCGMLILGYPFVPSSLTWSLRSSPACPLQLTRRNVTGPAVRTAAGSSRYMAPSLERHDREACRKRTRVAWGRKTRLRLGASHEADH